MFFFALFFACGTPQKSIEQSQQSAKTTQVENNQQAPKTTDAENNEQLLKNCIDKCVQSKQMEARSIESIKADCEKQCKNPVPKLELQPKGK